MTNPNRTQASLKEVYHLYADMLFRIALTHTANREDAEDAADDYVVANVAKETAEESVRKAVQGALDNLWGEPVPSGKYNVIMDESTVSSLLRVFSVAFSARNAYLGTTLLAGKEGQQIASETDLCCHCRQRIEIRFACRNLLLFMQVCGYLPLI